MRETRIERCPECGAWKPSAEEVKSHYLNQHQEHSEIAIKCELCGAWDTIPEYNRRAHDACSRECMKEILSAESSGEKSPVWVDGRTTRGTEWEIIVNNVRGRDSGVCQCCGCEKEEDGTRLHGHHITHEDLVGEGMHPHAPTNVVSTCPDCHKDLEGEPEEVQLSALGLSSRRELLLPTEIRANLEWMLDIQMSSSYRAPTRAESMAYLAPVRETTLSEYMEEA